MLENLVDIQNLTFKRDDRVIYDDISLSIPKGKVTAIMGPSGIGKTTLLRLIGGQLKPNAILYTEMHCAGEIFSLSYTSFVLICYVIIVTVMIIVNVSTICLIYNKRKQIRPTGQNNQGPGMNASRLNRQSLIHKTMLIMLIIYSVSWFTALGIKFTLSQCSHCDKELFNTIGNIAIMLPHLANGLVSIAKNPNIMDIWKFWCFRQARQRLHINVINVQPQQ